MIMNETENIIEVKYINIKWSNKVSALKIKESRDSIPIIKIGKNSYELEATTFTKINPSDYGQLAVRVLDDSIKTPPFLLKANKDIGSLISVRDNNTNKIWWVEGEKWSKSNKRWQSEAFRSAGSISLYIGDCCYFIKISSCSFSYEQLSKYLQDFKNDLWYLVLHETSYISAPVNKETKISIFDEESIRYFDSFTDFASNVLAQPKSELREVQELKSVKKVRPIPRTFMEIVTMGYKKQLTSRAYQPTLNLPENQYVLFTVNRIVTLLKNFGNVTNHIDSSLENRIRSQEERINNFSDKIKINRKAVVSEYENLKLQFENEQSKLDILVKDKELASKNDGNTNFHRVSLTVTLGRINPYPHYHPFLVFYVKKQEGLLVLKNNDYYQLFFDEKFKDKLFSDGTYKITALYKPRTIETQKGNKQCNLMNISIESIEVIDSVLERKFNKFKNAAIRVSNNDWERPISTQERNDQEQEIKEIKKSIANLSNLMIRNKTISIKLAPVLNKLEKNKKELIGLKIKPSSLFPNSMSFIQNPNYQGVHKLYKEIQQLSGLDEQLFVGLEKTENIGILNTSLIYERWCFLQIIKILIDKFKFLPEKDWKQKLLNQIINNKPEDIRNVEISFKNEDTAREIKLWYEKVLETGKRPDFIIDLTSYFDPNNRVSKRMVLDAKFKENIDDHGGISRIINKLYNKKDYAEAGANEVFILHPSPQAVPSVNTPQEWAKDTYLGETKLFDWDIEESPDPDCSSSSPKYAFPDHKYGAVLLTPIINSGEYLDSLQMCLGMFLQYGIEKNNRLECDNTYDKWICSQSHIGKKSGINPLTEEKIFCLVCGSSEYSAIVNKTPRGIKWEISCNECHHKTYYNYCASCGNRLIKHGPYWTYHATQALEPYNIKCPRCGEIAVKMEK